MFPIHALQKGEMAEVLEEFNTIFALVSTVGVGDTNIAWVHFTYIIPYTVAILLEFV